MRKKTVTSVLAGLLLGAALTGCTGEGGHDEELSADALLDEAHRTMGRLKTVTIASSTTGAAGSSYSSRQTTDLRGRCTNKITWTEGGSLEQIRIDDTDYVRPDRVYLDRWSGGKAAGGKAQDRWIKTPAANAKPGDGLVDCTWPFSAFGKAVKGDRTEIGGRPAVALRVTDEADEAEAEAKGTYTFYVATEGKPYLLEVRYKGTDYRSTTAFSAFDEPLGVRAPSGDDVLDAADAADAG
ncbi:hypothetical protein [Streptomyces sp. JH34]|uniref:hypothetical protein n=1 Tax=Streptomyces sp. JH34 TaxID=2793633 RepID=UPI0023FA1C4D|nr:hypothetical protein [Streptomyces sp. JH34]MDF6017710.1 hypothetical protein [Streptomyces sp. JH34]